MMMSQSDFDANDFTTVFETKISDEFNSKYLFFLHNCLDLLAFNMSVFIIW